MRKEDKVTTVEQIAGTIKEYGCFYLTNTASLNADKTSQLRRECFKNDIKLLVVKNTLLKKALESLEGDYSPLFGSLKGSTAIMFSNVGNAPAKLIKEFKKNAERHRLLAASDSVALPGHQEVQSRSCDRASRVLGEERSEHGRGAQSAGVRRWQTPHDASR